MNQHLVWNMAPEILSIGPITFRWYGLLFGSAFLVGFFIVRWMFRREGKPETDLDSLLLHMVIGTVIGARLGHCLFYDPAYYLSQPLEIFKIWEGGLASHGAAIGILISMALYVKKHPSQSYLWVFDRIVIPTALGGCFIRLGNFFNSEILGLPSLAPWAVIFSRNDLIPRHPVQLYEAISYLAIFVLLLLIYIFQIKPRTGLIFGVFLTTVFSSRIWLEFFKTRQEAFDQGFALNMGQILSLPLVALGLILIIRAFTRPAEQLKTARIKTKKQAKKG